VERSFRPDPATLKAASPFDQGQQSMVAIRFVQAARMAAFP